ncbi:unnamed protein product [Cuscuta campestris]|uniref:non-specific serine/threonine protein kinase n=1 Tax=Cuscuta campestris TaxID=132261 RepID=A0A484KBY0_9ASTE|nr:unnamed protein product [Cuscuta campestris]
MKSFIYNSEIVEAKDELNPVLPNEKFGNARSAERDGWKPPVMKKPANKYLDDDINQLFEAINLRASTSLDLSDRVRRDASKRPMRGPNASQGIGFSDPVSIKQALRGLCISQAAEVAAMKRLSKLPGSPRFSYRSEGISAVPEEGTSSFPSKVPLHLQASTSRSLSRSAQSSPRYILRPASSHRNNSNKIVPAETTSNAFQKVPHHLQESNVKSPDQNVLSSPQFMGKAISKIAVGVIPQDESVVGEGSVSSSFEDPQKNPPNQQNVPSPQPSKKFVSKSTESTTVEDEAEDQTSSVPSCTSVCGLAEKNECSSGLSKGTSNLSRRGSPSINKMHKLRRKGIPLTNAVKSCKDVRSTRSTSHAAKPTFRNKKLPKTKANQEPKQLSDDPNLSEDGRAICKRCQCELKDKKDESSNKLHTLVASAYLPTEVNTCSDKPGLCVNPVSKFNKISKLRGDFSQSSKSSIGDYSCSTTVSEESNMSGSSCGTKPHMSKDTRWKTINMVKKHHGFLGLGHFNLLKKLGCGDIGTVYLAELIETSCMFAIKVMDNEFLARRKKLARAQTEREILSILDHPFLPTLYAQFTSDNLSCLVMEFCPGGDLHVLRQRQPGRYFLEPAARFYVAEVLLALEYLHMLGVVYRDLKPENIMVREDGHIMLTDFDLSLRCSVNATLLKPSPSPALDPARISGPCAGSKCIDPFCAGPSCKASCFTPWNGPPTPRSSKLRVEEASSLPQVVVEPTEARSNSFVGTHEYLAPEIIKGEGHGSAVDWWTLGVFLYELLYGKTPFKGGGVDQTLNNVVLQNLKFPDSPIVSFQARDLIRGLLVKDPKSRLGSETGAAEIKRHPFFDGLNWALIRCATPPQVPEFCNFEVQNIAFHHDQSNPKAIQNSSMKGHLQFGLF